ncbi:hypothetical protein RE474_03390 [Methanolobus sediminis]|uniref:Uncharacterized protein n=1 Tax=Methanolobus sediminis TaxID=3072978 RepID=A0AA51ULI1_9EURY|nr:hypothetical protein [Methanolobus sediminis]WMW25776.1 hypothetical protein RE474_03390 [Methanolobus sediminis]
MLKALKETSDKLKDLPMYVYIAYLDDFVLSVTRDVYENKKLVLSFEFTILQCKDKIAINTIEIEKDIIKMIKQHSKAWKDEKVMFGINLFFQTNQNLNLGEWFDITDLFCGFSHLEEIIEDLRNFDLLLGSFDPDIIYIIAQNNNDLLNLFYEGLNSKINQVEFNSDMKPSEIETYIYDALNYTQMRDKAEYMSTDIRKRVDDLRKEIAVHVLAK